MHARSGNRDTDNTVTIEEIFDTRRSPYKAFARSPARSARPRLHRRLHPAYPPTP